MTGRAGDAAADAAGLPPGAGGGPPAGSDGQRAGGDPAGRGLLRWLRRAAMAAAVAAGVGGLFYAYLLQSRIQPTDADGAGNALQAWDMLHGNVLLSGWSLSDVSFYTTELPEYMLVELVRGLNADVVHMAAAITYTLVSLLAMVLAIGRATGREAVVRALVVAAIMLAPTLGAASGMLLLSPDHVGTQVPLLLVLLVLDRAEPRWYVSAVIAALLVWAEVADLLVVLVGAIPLAVVAAVRLFRHPARRYDLELLVAALVSVPVAEGVLSLIRHAGGFAVSNPLITVVSAGDIPQHLRVTAESVLLLYSADFFDTWLGSLRFVALLQLAGLALAGLASGLTLRGIVREGDRVSQVMVVAIVVNLAAYTCSATISGVDSARELAAVLPLGAVLAARLTAQRLIAGKLVPVVLAAVLGCAAILAYNAGRPPSPAAAQNVADWLAARHLRYGLGGYWQANNITLASAGRIQVRPVIPWMDQVGQDRWESEDSWYNPRLHNATFLVIDTTNPRNAWYATASEAQATFGPPESSCKLGEYTVLIWNNNLLGYLGRQP
jgi:hypothetical protein